MINNALFCISWSVCVSAKQQNVVKQQSATASAAVKPSPAFSLLLSSLTSAITDAASGKLVCTTVVLTLLNRLDWLGLSSVLRPHQHSIGYMGDYRSEDPTNSIKVLKEQISNKLYTQ